MPELFLFLIKVNVSLILFCVAYFFIMRSLTYYKLNRIFLLTGLLLSTIYPVLDLSFLLKESPKLIIAVQNQLPAAVQKASSGRDFWSVMIICFWTGVMLMALRMVIGLYSLFNIHRNSTPAKVNSYRVRLLKGNISTFSFWNNIYLNPERHQKEEISAVLKHEQVHIKDFHTFDILLAELATVFYWFNPGAWLMRKAIKENVEFITDYKTLKTGIDRKAYQYSMLQACTGVHASDLINGFNVTATKRRIVMMNSKQTSSLHLLSYLLVIVGIVFAISAFTVVKLKAKNTSTSFGLNIQPQHTRSNATKADGTATLITLENFQITSKSINAISLINNSPGGQINKQEKAQARIAKVEKMKIVLSDVPLIDYVNCLSTALQASAKINNITIRRTTKDTQVHTLKKARTYVNDKEVPADPCSRSILKTSTESISVRAKT